MNPSLVQLAAGMHVLFFVGLWAHQIVFMGTVSFLHMTVGVFLVLLMVAKTKVAWPLCLAYDGILTTSIAYKLYSTGVNWEHKASLVEVLVLSMGVLAVMTLLRLRMLRFVLIDRRE